MGVVFRAQDTEDGSTVAVKVLHPLMARSGDNAERFVREAATLASISHPAVLRYLAHGSSEGHEYLVTEWLEGRDLAERLKDAPLTLVETLELGHRVADALRAAHEAGIVHRDIKPSNLFLLGDDVARVRLLDFGVAHNRAMASMTGAGTAIGTPAYMSPEQAKADGEVDGRADLFSLGCVLWECLAGRRAFEGSMALGVLAKVLLEDVPPIGSLVDGVPQAVDDVLVKLLDKTPARRPDAGALAALFSEARHTLPLDDVRRPSLRPSAPPGLTEREQRVVSVVLARTSTRAEAETMTTHHHATSVARLAVMAERYGARVEELANGTVAAVLAQGSATDLARRAARIAVSLRALFDGASVGIATGRAVLAERLPVGEAIDAAAALYEQARARPEPGAIAIDETTAGLLDRRFEIGGDARGLLLVAEHDRDAPRTLLGRPTRFVGRKRELALLEAMIDEASEERASRAALVVAPSGVGKTRLLRELLRRLESAEERPSVWLTRGEVETAGSPYALVAGLVRDAASIGRGEQAEVVRAKLSSHVSARVPGAEAERVTTFLGELVGARGEASRSPQLAAARLDPRLMGDQIRRAFEDFVDASCEHAPVVLAVDDLQWGDKPSVELLDRALRNLVARPLVVLGLTRAELEGPVADPWAERTRTRIELQGLSEGAARRFVEATLDDVDSTRVDAIIARADGHAFTLEELVRAEADGRGAEVPETVLAMTQARLGALPSEERRLLRAASVFGRTFWRDGLEALLGRITTGPATVEGLTALAGRELLEARHPSRFEGDEEWAFRHSGVRDAAYGMLTEDDRELGHRLALQWLEQAGESDPFRLADHAERAGANEAAVRHRLRAAEQGLEGDDLEIAERCAERGIAAGAEGEALGRLRLVLATSHGWGGRHGEARRLAIAAREVLPRGSDAWVRSLERECAASLTLGLLDVFAQAEGLLDGISPTHMTARSLARLATGAFQAGQPERADALLARAEATPESVRTSPDVAGAIERARASRATRRGDKAACLVHLRQAATMQDAAGARRDACIERLNASVLEAELGLYEDAEAHLRDALEEAQRIGLAIVVDAARTNLGNVLALRGQHEEAREALGQALESLRDRGDRRFLGALHGYFARAWLAADRPAEAEGHARLSVEHLRDFAPTHPWALAVLAETLLARGQADEARKAAERALGIVESGAPVEMGEGLVRWVHVASLDATGDDGAGAAARRAAEALRERAQGITDPTWRESFLERIPAHAATLRRAERG